MTAPDHPEPRAAKIAGAEILAFPRAALPAAAPAEPSSHADEPIREDEGFGGDDGGRGGQTGGEDGDRDRRLALLPLTDLGNAERFAERFRDALRYCPAFGWLAWDGRRWKRDGAEEAVALAEHTTVRAIQDEAKALRKSADDVLLAEATRTKDEVWRSDKIAAWGRVSEGAAKLSSISKRAAAMLAIAPDALDRDPFAITVLNGTLHIAKRDDGPYVTLKPHDPADFITKLAPVTYDPEATCPKFDAFFEEIQDSISVRIFLLRWFGYSLTGYTGEQKMLFLYGKGRNGKGVLVNTFMFVAGDYADSIPIESFLDSGRARAGGQATPDIAGLVGVRVLSTSEPKKGAVLDEAFVKLFTGGDRIKARFLNKDYFGFTPQAKLTMQGNYRPKISGTDEGIWARMVLVPFAVTIPKDRQDPRLAESLRLEASGILNKLLDGLSGYLDAGLGIPNVVMDATASYRADSDPLGRFLEVCTRPTIGKRVQSSDLFSVFQAWAKANGETVWSPKGFGAAMTERGIASKKSSVNWYVDIELIKAVGDFVDHEGNPRHERPPARSDDDGPADAEDIIHE